MTIIPSNGHTATTLAPVSLLATDHYSPTDYFSHLLMLHFAILHFLVAIK